MVGAASFLSAFEAGRSVSKARGSSAAQFLAGAGDGVASRDRVSLSPLARERSAVAELFSTAGVGASRRHSQWKTPEEIRQDFQEDFAAFGSQFGGLLAAAKIGTGKPLVLAPDGVGHVRVQGADDRAGAVDRLFESSPEMVSRFMVMAARSALSDAFADPGFAADYEQDPPGAIRKHIDSLKTALLGFRLTIENGRMTTGTAAAAEA